MRRGENRKVSRREADRDLRRGENRKVSRGEADRDMGKRGEQTDE